MKDTQTQVERLAHAVAQLREAVLDHGEATTTVVRRAAYDGAPDEAFLADFVSKVREHADRISDADVAGLRSHGLSADAIFEVTVAAALGAAQRRLDAGLALLNAAPRR